MFDRIINTGSRNRLQILLVILLVTVAFGVLAARLGIDNSLEVWFVEDDPTLRSYQDFLEEFGNDEIVVIAIGGHGDALQPERLHRLGRLTESLEQIDGVARVHSLTNVGGARAENVQAVRASVARDGLASQLVGKDGASLVVVAWMDAGSDMDTERPRILDAIRAATRAELASGEQAHFGGVGVLHEALNRATIGEGTLFIGVSYLVISIALLLITRSLTWTLVALLVVTLADIALFGMMSLLGRPINMITIALPPVVMILGVANVVHMATDLDRARARGVHSTDGLRATLAQVATPCAFNALTTGVAFLSLTTASMAVTRDYGLFAAIGVGFAFAWSLSFVALALPRLSKPRRTPRSTERLADLAEMLMIGSLRRPRLVLAVTGLIVAASVVGASRIEVDTYSIGFLPENDIVRQDDRAIEEMVGPYLPMELTIRATGADWRTREFLEAVAAAQTAIESDPRIGRTTTVADVLRDVHFAATHEPAPRPWNPRNDGQIANAERLLHYSGNGNVLDHLIADDQRTLRLTATTPGMSVRNFVATAANAREAAQQAVGDRAEVTNSGYLPLYTQMIEHVVKDQAKSFAVAFVLVFLVVSLALRSWRFALVAIPPNLLPVGILLGVMGFVGIKLDIATVTVAAVVLGVIVDDTVHLLHRLRRELTSGTDLETAVRSVARASGLAVISTSLVFASGFFVISLAASDAVAHSGMLMAIAVVAALLTDLLLLPAFIALLFARTRGA